MSRAMFFYNNDCSEEQQSQESHALESCYLCSRPFTNDSEIFMYRGNTPFCSEDCREEQIQFDEARARKKKLAARNSEIEKANPTNDIRQGSIQVA